jgi:alkanesulfonate monooxygenase SsuD/methylene tetrahydromethanopterin reductase-like flavin-dependent oxidoreductase (luciferase family)
LDLFYEFSQGRPYLGVVGADRVMFEEVLEQAVVADELGFNCFWSTEHHGSSEISHMPAPEILLAAVALRTQRLRVGHCVRLTPYGINHPIRLAEQAAVLDNVSNGRLNMGFGRSVPREWLHFNVDPEETLGMQEETLRVVPRLWTEPYVEYQSDTLKIPRFQMVPRVLQQPHPPMSVSCASDESFLRAAHWGVGAMGLTLFQPFEFLERRIQLYKEAIQQAEPVGKFVTNACGAFTFVYCAETEDEAIHDGAPAAVAWYISKVAAHYWTPASTGLSEDEFVRLLTSDPRHQQLQALRAVEDSPAARVLIRLAEQQPVTDEEVYEAMTPQDQVIIGTPDQVVQKMKRYEAAGLDFLMCMVQAGPSLPHHKIVKSLRLIGEQVLPEFHRIPATTSTPA